MQSCIGTILFGCLRLLFIAARVGVLQVLLGVLNSLTTACWLWWEAVICQLKLNKCGELCFSAHLLSFYLEIISSCVHDLLLL
ncbi:uncharacterized protein BJ212DRAFT_994328 [Suillus subaureus]|uniref:Uncharacterized protein n=1 Tax=Suillus subaureus TaxID=48587 RepID=A0A9P7DUA0_9AGAM|nr:uncharacterized protein BJ212DRAFT_994328 [Suillus subaureus]KAG1803078.1 hypothetical protein BJ212DRAFT_994328 [Suillus subaureus]